MILNVRNFQKVLAAIVLRALVSADAGFATLLVMGASDYCVCPAVIGNLSILLVIYLAVYAYVVALS